MGIDMVQGMLWQGFQEELRSLLNKHSMDNECNTPDFILAGMMTEQLEAYRKTMDANIEWHAPKAIGKCAQ